MTTTPDEPAHSGLHPLSPYGEGYCRACLFVVGLDREGRLEQHNRAPAAGAWREECSGSGGRAPKAIPYASRKAAFTVKPDHAWCPACKQKVMSTRMAGELVYSRHYVSGYGKLCEDSTRAIRSS